MEAYFKFKIYVIVLLIVICATVFAHPSKKKDSTETDTSDTSSSKENKTIEAIINHHRKNDSHTHSHRRRFKPHKLQPKSSEEDITTTISTSNSSSSSESNSESAEDKKKGHKHDRKGFKPKEVTPRNATGHFKGPNLKDRRNINLTDTRIRPTGLPKSSIILNKKITTIPKAANETESKPKTFVIRRKVTKIDVDPRRINIKPSSSFVVIANSGTTKGLIKDTTTPKDIAETTYTPFFISSRTTTEIPSVSKTTTEISSTSTVSVTKKPTTHPPKTTQKPRKFVTTTRPRVTTGISLPRITTGFLRTSTTAKSYLRTGTTTTRSTSTTPKTTTTKAATTTTEDIDYDISKYVSPEFHDINNVYTQPISPEIAKFLIDNHTIRETTTVDVPSTPSETFDVKFKKVAEGIIRNVTPVEKQKTDTASDFVKSVQEYLKRNKNNTKVVYKDTKGVDFKNSQDQKSVHKDYTNERQTSVLIDTFTVSTLIDGGTTKLSDTTNSVISLLDDNINTTRGPGRKMMYTTPKSRVRISLKNNKEWNTTPTTFPTDEVDKVKFVQLVKMHPYTRRRPTSNTYLDPVTHSDLSPIKSAGLEIEDGSTDTNVLKKRGSVKFGASTTAATTKKKEELASNVTIPPTATAWAFATLNRAPVPVRRPSENPNDVSSKPATSQGTDDDLQEIDRPEPTTIVKLSGNTTTKGNVITSYSVTDSQAEDNKLVSTEAISEGTVKLDIVPTVRIPSSVSSETTLEVIGLATTPLPTLSTEIIPDTLSLSSNAEGTVTIFTTTERSTITSETIPPATTTEVSVKLDVTPSKGAFESITKLPSSVTTPENDIKSALYDIDFVDSEEPTLADLTSTAPHDPNYYDTSAIVDSVTTVKYETTTQMNETTTVFSKYDSTQTNIVMNETDIPETTYFLPSSTVPAVSSTDDEDITEMMEILKVGATSTDNNLIFNDTFVKTEKPTTMVDVTTIPNTISEEATEDSRQPTTIEISTEVVNNITETLIMASTSSFVTNTASVTVADTTEKSTENKTEWHYVTITTPYAVTESPRIEETDKSTEYNVTQELDNDKETLESNEDIDIFENNITELVHTPALDNSVELIRVEIEKDKDGEDIYLEHTTHYQINDDQEQDLQDDSVTAAVIISCIGVIALLALVALLVVRVRRHRSGARFAQRCTPVALDACSLDSAAAGQRKARSTSKRSYGNPAYDDEVVTSHPMHVAALASFAMDEESMASEFAEIPTITVKPDEVPPGCEMKNRYVNVLPPPETIVPLSRIGDDHTTEYINANFVTGPGNEKNYYIITQSPMSNTVTDFWRMVWEHNSRLILMLTEFMENGVEKCYEYIPPSEASDNRRSFANFQITLKKKELREKYVVSTLQLKNMKTKTWREVIHMWYFWPAKGVPQDYDSVINFINESRNYHKIVQGTKEYEEDGLEYNVGDSRMELYPRDLSLNGDRAHIYTPQRIDERSKNGGTNGVLGARSTNDSQTFRRIVRPTVIHCAGGAGRSAAIAAAARCCRELDAGGAADVPRAALRLRRDRPPAIQNKHQYVFVYKVLNEYARRLSGNLDMV